MILHFENVCSMRFTRGDYWTPVNISVKWSTNGNSAGISCLVNIPGYLEKNFFLEFCLWSNAIGTDEYSDICSALNFHMWCASTKTEDVSRVKVSHTCTDIQSRKYLIKSFCLWFIHIDWDRYRPRYKEDYHIFMQGCANFCIKPCSHVTSAFASNINNELCGNKWLCSHLTLGMGWQRSKKNANADVTCEQILRNWFKPIYKFHCRLGLGHWEWTVM